MADRKFFVSKERMRKDYRETPSMLALSRKYGVSKKLILNWMNKFGIKRIPANAPVEVVRRLAAQHLSAAEIAHKMGRCVTGINWIARKYGIILERKYLRDHPATLKYRTRKVPDHPFANKFGRVLVHRLNMEARLGRYLAPDEVVHHGGRDFSNNRKLRVFKANGEHLRFEQFGRVKRVRTKNPRARGGFAHKARATSSDR